MAKGSLTFPTNPLAAMRDLADLDAPPLPSPEPVSPDTDTEIRSSALTSSRKPVSTPLREDVSASVQTHASTHTRTEARASARKHASAGGSKDAGRPVSTEGANGLLSTVEAALESREPLTGGVKATVDMSPELSTRAKRYLADHRGQSTRQVLIALFDAFLTSKGY